MEPYQAVALAVMIAMAFVVNSTLKLNRFRKQIGVRRTMFNVRDLSVIRQPRNYETEEVRHARATTSATITNDNGDDSDYSFEIVAIEDIGLVDDSIPAKNSVSDKSDGGSSGGSLGTPVVIPGYMEFDPKLAAASTMRKKHLPLPSLTSLSDKGGLIAEAFFDFSTKRQ